MNRVLSITNKIAFILAALFGISGTLITLIHNDLSPPKFILILFMISALLFLITFTTVILQRVPQIPSQTLSFALVMFSVGSFGSFLSAFQAYMLEPFLRISLIGSIFLVIGSIGLMYDIFFRQQPKFLSLLFILISIATFCLLISSICNFKSNVSSGDIWALCGFLVLGFASIVNLISI